MTPCLACTILQARVTELAAEVERLRARDRSRAARGRQGAVTGDEKVRLVAAICLNRCITRDELAGELGINAGRLTPSNAIPACHRETIMTKLREMAHGLPLPAPPAPAARRRKPGRCK